MITDINSEDRLVQKTFADHLRDVLGWESIYAHNEETFGPAGTLPSQRTRSHPRSRSPRRPRPAAAAADERGDSC